MTSDDLFAELAKLGFTDIALMVTDDSALVEADKGGMQYCYEVKAPRPEPISSLLRRLFLYAFEACDAENYAALAMRRDDKLVLPSPASVAECLSND